MGFNCACFLRDDVQRQKLSDTSNVALRHVVDDEGIYCSHDDVGR